jgi:AraC-like DNA-binding protein
MPRCRAAGATTMHLNDSHGLPVRFEHVPVPTPLARWVEFIWMLRVDADQPLQHRVVPAGAADLVLACRGTFYDAGTGQRYLEGPGLVVSGPCARLLPLRSAGPVTIIGARLVTAGAFSLLRVPLSELRGGCLPLSDFRGSILKEASDHTRLARLCEMGTRGALLLHFERLLIALASNARAPEGPVPEALSLIHSTGGQVRVAALAKALGVTGRHLERCFQCHVGLSPKVYCRLARFHHLRTLLEVPRRPDWSHLACECGYYDQAHLIREFRHFTGRTPNGYRADCAVGFLLYGREQGA